MTDTQFGSAGTACPTSASSAESGSDSRLNVIPAQSQHGFEEKIASAADLESGLSWDRRNPGLEWLCCVAEEEFPEVPACSLFLRRGGND